MHQTAAAHSSTVPEHALLLQTPSVYITVLRMLRSLQGCRGWQALPGV